MPNEAYPNNQQETRRRRSDRHGHKAEPNPYQPPQPRPQRANFQPDDDRAPLPLSAQAPQQPENPQAPRRQPPQSYDYERFPPREPEYEDDYDDLPPLWPKLLALGLGLLLLIAAALYFLVPENTTGLMGTLRGGVASAVDGVKGLVGLKKEEPPKLIKFETPLAQVPTGVKTVFTFTADQPVDGVRMIDDLGTDIKGQLAAVDPEKTVWTLSVVFDDPMEGTIRASVLKGETWYDSDKVISFGVTVPTATPAPVFTMVPMPTDAPAQTGQDPFVVGTPPTDAPQQVGEAATPFVVTGVTVDPSTMTLPTFAPAETISAVTIITAAPRTAAPQAQLSEPGAEEPAPVDTFPDVIGEVPAVVDPVLDEPVAPLPADLPTEAPVATAVPVPTATPMPMLPMTADESADPGKLRITDTVYHSAKKTDDLKRELPVSMPQPSQYVSYEGGVFTFRNDSFRGNAAFGTAEMPLQQLSVLWQAPLGSLRTGDGTLYGLGWTSQPAIVKWSVELRDMMNLTAEKKEVKALKEVIVGAQDGKIYFFDLNDGVPTRDPINVGYPMKGSVAVDTQGRPLIAVGQAISKMPNKTGPIGLRMFELIGQEELYFLNGRKTKQQQQYSTNGAFDGTALFDRSSDTMVVAGENGLLYTVQLNSKFDYLEKFSITVDPTITYLRTKAANQADMSVSNEASVAMYGTFAYTADRHGIIRAVDTNSMKTQWAFDAGDNTDATPALGFDEDGSLGLYTGTTVFARQRKAGTAYIRRLDALSGKEVWKVEVPAKWEQFERGGVKASPVVGEHSISDLVIFTVNMTGDGGGATMLALNKQTGQEVWKYNLGARSVSSPVAVYTEAGVAYIIQADEKGVLTLLDGRTGQMLHTLDLEGSIDGSPAVYNDVLVIGTNDKDNNFLYGIRLE